MPQLWEFSLTDARMSRISHFMAETLYDENVGWIFWNTHIALWKWFDECVNEKAKDLNDSVFKKSIWLNESAEHVDIISTENRKVIGTLPDNSEIVIYDNWHFAL